MSLVLCQASEDTDCADCSEPIYEGDFIYFDEETDEIVCMGCVGSVYDDE